MSDRPTHVRTRFAPSPTGFVHIGGLRTVIFNWLWAKHNNGEFLLRIEDTDRKRYVAGAEEQLKSSLRDVGLQWDEGPDVGGPHAPYQQSQRLELYQRYADELVQNGVAYRSYVTAEEIQAINDEREQRGTAKLLEFRNLPNIDDAQRAADDAPFNIRLALKRTGQMKLHDFIRGEIVFDLAKLNMPDPVILKSDGFPTYALAAMVDDHEMQISHVMRADEWIPTWPVHVQILQALGWQEPVWIHVPQVLGNDGKKLSKRHGDTSVTEYLDAGFLPEAIINYLALVGWSYDDHTEIMSIQELIERFDIKRIKPSPGVFDREKLLHFNGVYLRAMSPEKLAPLVAPYLSKAELISPEPTVDELARIAEVLPLVQDRLKLLSDAPEALDFFLAEPAVYDPALLVPKKTEPRDTLKVLDDVHALVNDVDDWTAETLDAKFHAYVNDAGLKIPQVFMPTRVAVTGRTQSPGLFETLVVLGKATVLQRLAAARTVLADSL